MIKGNDCWSADKISGMRTVSISGRELSVSKEWNVNGEKVTISIEKQ